MNIRVLKKSKSLRDKETKRQRDKEVGAKVAALRSQSQKVKESKSRCGIRSIRSIRVLKYSFSFCGFCVKQIPPILRET